MSIKLAPKVSSSSLFPPGVYPAKILNSCETVSKKGNPMVVTQSCVVNGKDNQIVSDYMAYNFPAGADHLRQLLAIRGGDPNVLENVKDLEGMLVSVELTVEHSAYGTRNKIEQYLPPIPGTPQDLRLEPYLTGKDRPQSPSLPETGSDPQSPTPPWMKSKS